MIELRNISKAFGSRIVLRKVNLTINEGDFVTLMGPNGVGKTTLLHLIATLSKPTAGTILINGYDLADSASQLRRFIGVVSHKTLLYDDLTAMQNLSFYAQMYDVVDSSIRIESLLKQVGLWGRQNDLVRTYSRGMQQRLSIARALLHNPPILILDEPDTGLDQHATQQLGDLLTEMGGDSAGSSENSNKRTTMMTTHNLDWGVSMGNRAVVLAKGQVAYDSQGGEISMTQVREYY
ncbi:heme ABC exporter ATP-binding protein CcmA [Anaerolineales bacterium HSG25]|nr:heme ABC exporter ATP-binding protein CcmA [Anaerolineales bacterium HSG25]